MRFSTRSIALAVALVVVVVLASLYVAHARATRVAEANQQIVVQDGYVDQPIEAKSVRKPSGSTVYITKTGAKYHRSGCRSLRKSCIPITRADAIKRGYGACKICKP